MPKISVIIPLYNGEVFLCQTLESLSLQNFSDFEVIIVDDCSMDRSAQIVRSYAERDARFRYIKTFENLGIVAKVMNFAAEFAQGDFFVYSSQDDLYSVDWLEKMYSSSLRTGADAVLPDLEFYREGAEHNRQIVGLKGDRSIELSGREAFVYSLDWTIPGNALWRIEFLKNFGFSDFGTFADEYTVRQFFLQCKKVAFCAGVFFYRSDNPQAITRKLTPRLLDESYNNLMLWRLIIDNSFGADVHGPQAVKTIRSIIRSKKMIAKHPEFAPYQGVVDACFGDIKSQAFKKSLQAGLGRDTNFLKTAIYMHVWTSKRMVGALAAIGVISAAIKSSLRGRKLL